VLWRPVRLFMPPMQERIALRSSVGGKAATPAGIPFANCDLRSDTLNGQTVTCTWTSQTTHGERGFLVRPGDRHGVRRRLSHRRDGQPGTWRLYQQSGGCYVSGFWEEVADGLALVGRRAGARRPAINASRLSRGS
jgi:hypothetical protein